MNIERVTYVFGFVFVGIMLLVGIALFFGAPSLADNDKLSGMERLTYALVGASSLGAVVLLSALGAVVVIKMAVGTIDLKYLVAENDGSASLSRFQMLLFTFVIAALYFLYALYSLKGTGMPTLPDIPNSVLGLLGISGGSYLLSKGIQAASNSSGGAGSGASAGSNGGGSGGTGTTPAIRKNNQ
jgi:hypothetical protein